MAVYFEAAAVITTKTGRKYCGKNCRDHAEYIGDTDTKRYQCKHVETAIEYGTPSAYEERPGAPKYDRRRKPELYPLRDAGIDQVS